MNITGNTIFFPGATSGIGLGLGLRFHQLGNTVIIGGRRTELLNQINTDQPGIHTIEIDTTDPESITAAAAEVLAGHPNLNVLIPMAGIMLPEDFHNPDYLEVAERTVATNLLGPIRLIAAFTPHLASQESSTILTVSSGLAFVPLPIAIHAFSEALRVQPADTTIQVIELVPPAVQTALMNEENSPMAMPLDAFLDEVMGLLKHEPDAPDFRRERQISPLRHRQRFRTRPVPSHGDVAFTRRLFGIHRPRGRGWEVRVHHTASSMS
jgi:uncharacterized oxidoreductase